MTQNDFINWCDRHCIKPELAAVVLGCSRASVFRYVNGSSAIPSPISNQCELIDLLPPEKSTAHIKKRLALVSR